MKAIVILLIIGVCASAFTLWRIARKPEGRKRDARGRFQNEEDKD
jgi:hypothetical protein